MSQNAQASPIRSGEMLDATERLFTKFGYRRTAMEDIAREAGVAKGTLYLHFANKADLFRAMLARNFAADQDRCDTVEKSGGCLARQLSGLLDAWFGSMFRRYGGSDHFAELASARRAVGTDIAQVADEAFEARLSRLMTSAERSGEANLATAQLDTAAFVAVLLAAARGAKYADGSVVTPEFYTRRLGDIGNLFAAAVAPR